MINRLTRFIKSEWKDSRDVSTLLSRSRLYSLYKLISARLMYGATTEDYLSLEMYNNSSRKNRSFLTSSKNWKILHDLSSKESIDIINNKYKFNTKFNNYLGRDWIFASQKNNNIDGFIEKYKSVIVKPVDGCEGKGIYILSKDDRHELKELNKSLSNGAEYMIEQLLTQHEEMARLNPDCINTVRVETMIDSKGNPHITNTIAIMGTKGGLTNNAHNGGIMCHIDPDGGFITGAARNPKGIKSYYHPDSHLALPGFKIPEWNKIIDFAKELALVLPDARYVGWDIALTPVGPVVIEGNINPGHCTQACDMVGRWPLLKSLI